VQVRLVRPGTWKAIWSYALGPAEDALCVKAMQLKNAKTGASPAGWQHLLHADHVPSHCSFSVLDALCISAARLLSLLLLPSLLLPF